MALVLSDVYYLLHYCLVLLSVWLNVVWYCWLYVIECYIILLAVCDWMLYHTAGCIWLNAVSYCWLYVIESYIILLVVYDWMLYHTAGRMWLNVVWYCWLYVIECCITLLVVYDWMLYHTAGCLWMDSISYCSLYVSEYFIILVGVLFHTADCTMSCDITLLVVCDCMLYHTACFMSVDIWLHCWLYIS